MTADEIKIGRVYSAKRPTRTGAWADLWNDRQVMWISVLGDVLQYDSAGLPNGRLYPKVSMEAFLKWAKADVTDQCPKSEWRKAI